jgi:hypothetical protein
MHPETLAALLAAIRAELQADPSQRGYAGKSATEIAALMNAPIVVAPPTAHRDVSISDVEGYLRARLLVTQLRAWAGSAPSGTAKMAADELLDIIASPRLSLFTTSTEAGRANVLGLFATLVSATGGIITQTHLAELTAMTVAPSGASVTEAPRWAVVAEGIGGVGNLPGPPNAATEELIAEAVNGG